jgi:hypothetical protein
MTRVDEPQATGAPGTDREKCLLTHVPLPALGQGRYRWGGVVPRGLRAARTRRWASSVGVVGGPEPELGEDAADGGQVHLGKSRTSSATTVRRHGGALAGMEAWRTVPRRTGLLAVQVPPMAITRSRRPASPVPPMGPTAASRGAWACVFMGGWTWVCGGGPGWSTPPAGRGSGPLFTSIAPTLPGSGVDGASGVGMTCGQSHGDPGWDRPRSASRHAGPWSGFRGEWMLGPTWQAI